MEIIKALEKLFPVNKIFLDVDGVIFDSCEAVIQLLNEKYGGNFHGCDVTNWDFKCCYPNMTSEEVEAVFADKRFFDIVKPIDGALEFIKKYKNKVVIVTKSTIDNLYYKHKWFEDRGIDVPIIGLPLNISKGLINMRSSNDESVNVFIDDSTANLEESNADVRLMFCQYDDGKVREWQKGWEGLRLYRWEWK